MNETHTGSQLCRHPRVGWRLHASLLCAALLCGGVMAQPQPSAKQPGPKPDPTAKAEPASKAKPGKKRQAIRGRSSRKGPKASNFKMNPNAKWACDKQTVTREPVWRGDKQLTFAFDIRNEGTENLKIKARGG